MSELLLGVDVGTSGTKGVLTRPDGRVVAVAMRQHGISMPFPGWSEHDAVKIWWDEFRTIARELAGGVDARDIAAIGVSGIGPCLLPASASGNPLRPAILYGIDTRATAEIASLHERFDPELIRARCGTPLTSQAIGPKMLWLQRREPAVWQCTRRWFMTNAYLAYRLTGAYALDHNSASQAAPFYDPHAAGWLSDWCEAIAPGLEWPHLLRPMEIAGTVTRVAAEETGLTEGTPVAIGSTDAWAEACSAGAIEPGDAMVMYGSSMALIGVLSASAPSPQAPNTISVSPGVFEGQTNLVATLPTAGAVATWLSHVTSATHATLNAEAAAAGPGAGGLMMLPYFAGLRTPESDPCARGAILGLTTRHKRGHLYRAVLESIGFAIRHNLEAMSHDVDEIVTRLIATGGGTHGGLAVQISSDITKREQHIPRYTIGACHGDALLAGLATDLVPDPQSWNPVASVVTPQASNGALYDELYSCYLQLHGSLRDPMRALASLQTQLG